MISSIQYNLSLDGNNSISRNCCNNKGLKNEKNNFDNKRIFISLINIFLKLLLIDFIFVSINILTNNYIGNSLKPLISILGLSTTMLLSLRLSKNLWSVPNEFSLSQEKCVRIDFSNKQENNISFSEFQHFDSLRVFENGITSTIYLLMYPLRFGIFGYLLFDKYWNIVVLLQLITSVLILTLTFEFFKITIIILPEQEYFRNKAHYFVENLERFFFLKLHEEIFQWKSKHNSLKSYFQKSIKYVITLIQLVFTLKMIFKATNHFVESSANSDLSKVIDNNPIYFWLSIYLFTSIKHVNSCLIFFIYYFEMNSTFFISDYKYYLRLQIHRILHLITQIPRNFTYFSKKNGSPTELKSSPVIDLHNPMISPFEELKSTQNQKCLFQNDNSIDLNHLQANKTLIQLRNVSLKYSNNYGYEEKRYYDELIQRFASYFHNNKLNKIDIHDFIAHLSTKSNGTCDNRELNNFSQGEISLSIDKNDFIIIFGTNKLGMDLLTKFISGFPGIKNEKLNISSIVSFNPNVYLLNEKMLEFVSGIFEFHNSNLTLDPLDFILLGNPFKKEIFEIIYNSFLIDYFTFDELLFNDNLNKNIIYPNIENNQHFIEAKIALQLSQFLYNILILSDNYSNTIIIIDGIFELLSREAYIKLINAFFSDNSKLNDYKLSFIITVSDYFIPLSIYNNNNSIKLILLDDKGTHMLNKLDFDETNRFNSLIDCIPPPDNIINRIFVDIPSSKKVTSCSKSLYSINELYFKYIKRKDYFRLKYLLFTCIIGFISFFTKYKLFSFSAEKSDKIDGNIDFMFFQIASFGSISLINTSNYLFSFDILSLFVGYFAISSLSSSNESYILPSKIVYLNSSNVNEPESLFSSELELTQFSKMSEENNFNSSFFLRFNGRQILRSSSSFHKEHFLNSQVVSIPANKLTGFKHAINSSRIIQKRFSKAIPRKLTEESRSNSSYNLPGDSNKLNFIPGSNFTSILIKMFVIDITSKLLIILFIFGFSFSLDPYNCKSCFREFTQMIFLSDNPITVINDTKMRKNKYCHYLLDEIYFKKNKIITHYLSIIQNITSLLLVFIFTNSKQFSSNYELLLNRNLWLFILSIIFVYNLVRILFINSNVTKTVGYPSFHCNSLDYLFYLYKTNSISWFNSEKHRLIDNKKKINSEHWKNHSKLQFYSLISSLMVSIFILLTNRNYFSTYLLKISNSFMFLPFIFPFFQMLYIHAYNTFKKNNKPYFNNFIKWIKLSFNNSNYLLLSNSKITSETSSPKTVISLSDSNGSNYLKDGLELSTPVTKKSSESNSNLLFHSLQEISNSGNNICLVNPNSSNDDKTASIFNHSPLYPIALMKKVGINSLDRIAVISDEYLINSNWSVKMVLDPKILYTNDILIKTMEKFEIFPKEIRKNSLLLNLSVEDYYSFLCKTKKCRDCLDTNAITHDFQASDDTYKTNGYGLEYTECSFRESLLSNLNNFKKLLLFGHFSLYSEHYDKLILIINCNVDLGIWVSFIKNYADNELNSLINNIIFVSKSFNSLDIQNNNYLNNFRSVFH
ncbi:integral membrane protein with 12 or more transmembrane domains [Cryptosporidium felis]|nr:integral membrane protein with 12 or more transmembrane domains [Cryptosporidium felis]